MLHLNLRQFMSIPSIAMCVRENERVLKEVQRKPCTRKFSHAPSPSNMRFVPKVSATLPWLSWCPEFESQPPARTIMPFSEENMRFRAQEHVPLGSIQNLVLSPPLPPPLHIAYFNRHVPGCCKEVVPGTSSRERHDSSSAHATATIFILPSYII